MDIKKGGLKFKPPFFMMRKSYLILYVNPTCIPAEAAEDF